jgi:hypothetical protein
VPVKFTFMADILFMERKIIKSKIGSSEAVSFGAHVSFSVTLSFFSGYGNTNISHVLNVNV